MFEVSRFDKRTVFLVLQNERDKLGEGVDESSIVLFKAGKVIYQALPTDLIVARKDPSGVISCSLPQKISLECLRYLCEPVKTSVSKLPRGPRRIMYVAGHSKRGDT